MCLTCLECRMRARTWRLPLTLWPHAFPKYSMHCSPRKLTAKGTCALAGRGLVCHSHIPTPHKSLSSMLHPRFSSKWVEYTLSELSVKYFHLCVFIPLSKVVFKHLLILLQLRQNNLKTPDTEQLVKSSQRRQRFRITLFSISTDPSSVFGSRREISPFLPWLLQLLTSSHCAYSCQRCLRLNTFLAKIARYTVLCQVGKPV